MYARQSPFYEILLSDIQKKTIFISQSKEEKRTIYNSLAFIKASRLASYVEESTEYNELSSSEFITNNSDE